MISNLLKKPNKNILVKEAINIKRTSSDLNRDRWRHHLPSAYNRLISSRDSSPSGLGHVTSPNSQ